MHSTRAYILAVFLVVAAVLLSGCGSTLKQTWNNFTAYYNTYYNAKRAYQTGIEQVRDQSVSINPEQPIRIHPAPVGAGQQNFKKAINKGAKILRKYPDSRWVDNALSLIGKSYYYRQEYFSAEQKFRELYANAQKPEMKQRAVLWRGRILMEMELYSQGISYLQNELGDRKEWEPEIEAEIRSLLAELYSYLNQWESANNYLVDAIPRLENKRHKARAYFLHGQVLERMDRLEEAFGAYRKVPGMHPEYDLIYHARRKQAEVSREDGNLKRAYRIFVEMSKDDKNFEILPELRYEIARTLQAMGKTQEARQEYKDVLFDPNHQPNPPTTAKTYYGLANLYRDQLLDFKTAAAYYDSAASVNVEEEKLPVNFQASQLSESFGEYASLKKQISEADSLMRLGNLPKAEFDSVLAEIRKKRVKKMEKMRKNQRSNANPVAGGGGQQYEPDQSPSAAKTSGSGFLNYQNKKRVFEERQQFQSYWGDRPLVDHWRRIDMIREMKQESDTSITKSEKAKVSSSGRTLQELNINLKEIPFSKEAQVQKQQEIYKAQYELANTFFLSLNMPDSARRYYNKILNRAPDTTSIVPQALYSLSELYFIDNDSVQARKLADRIVEQYPETEFARQVADRFGYTLPEQDNNAGQNRSDSAYVTYQQLTDTLETRHSLAQARAFNNFADHYGGSRTAAYALYRSATEYADAAKIKSRDTGPLYSREAFENLFSSTDSASQPIASLKSEPANLRGSGATCSGRYWDSTRAVVGDLHANYSGIRVVARVNPASERDSLYTCRDVQLEADMSSDMKQYVDRLSRARPYDHSLDSAGHAFVKLREQLLKYLKAWKAEKLHQFALSHSGSKIAPTAMHEAAREYMKIGRRDSAYYTRVDRWYAEKERYKREKDQLEARRDSVRSILDKHDAYQEEKKNNNKAARQEPNENQKVSKKKTPSGKKKQPNRGQKLQNKQQKAAENQAKQADDNQGGQNTESDTTDQISQAKLDSLQNRLKKLQDSTATPPDYKEVFPYEGFHWDSARAVLDQFTRRFASSRLNDEVEQLQEELSVPDILTQKQDTAARSDSAAKAPADTLNQSPIDSLRQARAANDTSADQGQQSDRKISRNRSVAPPDSLRKTADDTSSVADSVRNNRTRRRGEGNQAEQDTAAVPSDKEQAKIYTCEEMEITPNFDGNMQDFSEKIDFPKKYQQMRMEGEANFEILFDKQGAAEKAEPKTMGTKEGFNEAIQEAIKKHITVDPVVQEGDTVQVRCNLTIPIILNQDQ